MTQKGHNSVLFDFWSIVDKEITAMNFLTSSDLSHKDVQEAFYDFKYHVMNPSNNRKVLENLEWHRMFGVRDLFEEALEFAMEKTNRTTLSQTASQFLQTVWNMYEKDILFGDKYRYPVMTKCINLLNAYHVAGSGVVTTTVHCTSENQKNFIRRLDKKTNIVVEKYEELDLSKYGRLVIGEVENAIRYNPKEPKSIVLLNFRKNFEEENIEIPKKELIARFGDIHSIEIIEAYTNLEEEK